MVEKMVENFHQYIPYWITRSYQVGLSWSILEHCLTSPLRGGLQTVIQLTKVVYQVDLDPTSGSSTDQPPNPCSILTLFLKYYDLNLVNFGTLLTSSTSPLQGGLPTVI